MATTEIETTASAGKNFNESKELLSNKKIHAIFEAASALTSLSGGSGNELAAESLKETEGTPIMTPSHSSTYNEEQMRGSQPLVPEKTTDVQSRYLKKTVRHLPDHKKPNAALTFPEKLMNMMDFAEEKLENGDGDYCIAWQPDGLSFIIRHPQDFTRDVLTLFFKQTKFSSFTRKLYRWGFRQVNRGAPGASANPNEPVVFGNDFFQRDNKSLISKMRSVTAASVKRSLLPKDPAAHVLPWKVSDEPQQVENNHITFSRKRKQGSLEENKESIRQAAPGATARNINADDQLKKSRFLQMALDCADSYKENSEETSKTHSVLTASISSLHSQTAVRMNPSFQTPDQILASSLVANPSVSPSFPLSAVPDQFGTANGNTQVNTNALANSLLLKSRIDILAAQGPMFSLKSALTAGLVGRNDGLFLPPTRPTPQATSSLGAGGGREFSVNSVNSAEIVNEAIDALRFAS